jgi:hypothetical protein
MASGDETFCEKPIPFLHFRIRVFRPSGFALWKGHSVYEMRKNIGAVLAKESPVKNADLVVPVPDSGVPSAIGYAQKAACRLSWASSATIMWAAPLLSRRRKSAIWA